MTMNEWMNEWMMITTAVSMPVHWLIEWIFRLQQSALVIKVQQKVFDWVHGHSSLSMIQDKNSDHSTTIPISIHGEWVHLLLAQAI